VVLGTWPYDSAALTSLQYSYPLGRGPRDSYNLDDARKLSGALIAKLTDHDFELEIAGIIDGKAFRETV